MKYRLAHFLPQIESGIISPSALRYETRSEIWMISSKKVQEMLSHIEAEKTMVEGERFEFSKLGCGYFGFRAHNCFTWAQYHLRHLGIEFEEKNRNTIAGFVAYAAKDYTQDLKYYEDIEPSQRI